MKVIKIKSIICTALLLLFCAWSAFAITETIHFSAVIPEDHGIIFPDNVLRLDHLFFSMDNVLIDEEETTDVGMDLSNSFIVDIIYYGNLSSDYEVTLSANASSGWLSGDNPLEYIPINISFREFLGENGIKSTVVDSDDSLDISVPASGPIRGQKVGEMIVSWESGLVLQPGMYDMELNLSLRSR